MKKSILSIVLLLASFTIIAQSQNDWVCRLGFDYEISWLPNWGKGKPVITSVYPYSSAEQSGLKVHDIIETIDGVPVTDLSTEEIAEKMNIAGKHEVLFTISNLAATDKKVTVRKECKPANAITEDQLAVAFSMYSLESTSERTFICPFMTTVTPEPIDFAVFRTFAFSAIDHTNTLEQTINDCIEKELVKKRDDRR
ncbi:MAG: PDZ domain-containing protein [Tannerellaceae bacterium]|nr:PDZ domain-containing protein [Tannerellaceae bacterium]